METTTEKPKFTLAVGDYAIIFLLAVAALYTVHFISASFK